MAISGGVDSSTSAALLLEAGYDCTGAFMITSDQSERAQAEAEGVARVLGIKLYVLDLRRDFEQILDYFCDEYRRGRTPNPCILCNRYIKFGKLWEFARDNGADLLATGHYARIMRDNNGAKLYEAADATKDQSYALSMVKKEVLRHVILPMGDYSKEQTRELAGKFGLGTEDKTESQEICFIPNDNYAGVLERRYPELARPGKIIDSSGKILGEHKGVHRYTIGQRRGLAVAMGEPYYVVRIDAESNTITLGPKEEVMHRKLSTKEVNWLIDEPGSAFGATVKIRYNDCGAAAKVIPRGDGAAVEFNEPNSAITPGQLAVFYGREEDRNQVLGGGWIENASD